ncbi:MAG: nucleoside-diphosphate sugar epimerase/dehydratase, partial [bacterium]
MKANLLNNRILAILHDLAMVPVAWVAAFWVRYNMGSMPDDAIAAIWGGLVVLVAVQAFAFQYYGLYRGVWRFASIPDLFRIVKAVVVGAAFAAIAVFLLTRMEGVPRSVFPLYCLLLITLLGGSRLLVRWSKDRHLYKSGGKRVLIVGAGKAGEMLVR